MTVAAVAVVACLTVTVGTLYLSDRPDVALGVLVVASAAVWTALAMLGGR